MLGQCQEYARNIALFGSPKSQICRQARKEHPNGRFGTISEQLGAGYAQPPFWKSEIANSQAGPVRASERSI